MYGLIRGDPKVVTKSIKLFDNIINCVRIVEKCIPQTISHDQEQFWEKIVSFRTGISYTLQAIFNIWPIFSKDHCLHSFIHSATALLLAWTYNIFEDWCNQNRPCISFVCTEVVFLLVLTTQHIKSYTYTSMPIWRHFDVGNRCAHARSRVIIQR